MLDWFSKQKKITKIILIIGSIIVFFIFLIVFLNLFAVIIYGIDDFITLTELSEIWIEFWGVLLSTSISGIVLFITVRWTIRNSNKELLLNINEMEKNRKLGIRPVLTNINISESSQQRQFITQKFSKDISSITLSSYHEIIASTSTEGNIDGINLSFCYRNIGLGPAIDIEISIDEVDKIEGITKLHDIFTNQDTQSIISDYFQNTNLYNKERSSNWVLYTSFSLGINTEKCFILNFSHSIQELYLLINISYFDILHNQYYQNHFIAVDCPNKQRYVSTISKQLIDDA